MALLVTLAGGATRAQAQAGPAYPATPPTHGALYRDAPSDRWMLGGTWLKRADPADGGVGAAEPNRPQTVVKMTGSGFQDDPPPMMKLRCGSVTSRPQTIHDHGS